MGGSVRIKLLCCYWAIFLNIPHPRARVHSLTVVCHLVVTIQFKKRRESSEYKQHFNTDLYHRYNILYINNGHSYTYYCHLPVNKLYV